MKEYKNKEDKGYRTLMLSGGLFAFFVIIAGLIVLFDGHADLFPKKTDTSITRTLDCIMAGFYLAGGAFGITSLVLLKKQRSCAPALVFLSMIVISLVVCTHMNLGGFALLDAGNEKDGNFWVRFGVLCFVMSVFTHALDFKNVPKAKKYIESK